MGCPAVEAVEDVGAVHHGRPVHPRVLPSQALTPAPRGATCLGRAHRARPSASHLEEKEEEVAAGDDVQIGRRLVKQTQVMWGHQLQHELDPPPLPFRHGPDGPVLLPGAPRVLTRPAPPPATPAAFAQTRVSLTPALPAARAGAARGAQLPRGPPLPCCRAAGPAPLTRYGGRDRRGEAVKVSPKLGRVLAADAKRSLTFVEKSDDTMFDQSPATSATRR